jgi:transposase-like protein
MNSVPISQRISSLAQRLSQGNEAGELTSDLVRQAARLVVEQMLETEVDEFLGRQRYQRRSEDSGEVSSCAHDEAIHGPLEPVSGKGYRNGHKRRQLRTAEGKVPIELPQVRDADGWSSALWPQIRHRTEVLDKLAVEMYARGLSTRDIEDLLGEIDDGDGRSLLSRSSVSRITEVLWEEFESFAQRDLSGFDVVYLFCDAVYESLRQQAGCKQAILVTWGILLDGSKVLIHLSLGNKESQSSWQEHFRSLIQRGLPNPLTVTSDGAPGCVAAIEATWPSAERIRCWVHKMRNVLEKVSEDQHEAIKRLLFDVRDAPNHAMGEQRAEALITELKARGLHQAAACLEDDLDASLAHLKLPLRHRKTVRTTNLCERSFVEQRRRAKVLPRFRSEKECLKLVYATLWRSSERWRKVKFTALERGELERYIKARLADGFEVRHLELAA